jgi:hypothetical protein
MSPPMASHVFLIDATTLEDKALLSEHAPLEGCRMDC